MVTHFSIDGHLACGREGDNLKSTTDPAQVKCRNCRHTEAFAEAQGGGSSASTPLQGAWRNEWRDRLSDMAGPHRLPRGFAGQYYV